MDTELNTKITIPVVVGFDGNTKEEYFGEKHLNIINEGNTAYVSTNMDSETVLLDVEFLENVIAALKLHEKRVAVK